MERKYVSYNKLSHFLSKLKTIFSDINHTHTISNVDTLQDTLDTLQNDLDVLEQNVADLGAEINDKELPVVTTDDNGSFLRVVNGAWSIDTIPLAEEGEF